MIPAPEALTAWASYRAIVQAHAADLVDRLHILSFPRSSLYGRTIGDIWLGQSRADCLLSMAIELGIEHQTTTTAVCACARTVLHNIPARDTRPLAAIEAAEKWCRGEVSEGIVRAAAGDAYDAASFAAGWGNPDCYYHAARSAYYAARTVDEQGSGYACFAIEAAARSAAKTLGDRHNALLQLAPVVREHIGIDRIVEALAARKAERW